MFLVNGVPGDRISPANRGFQYGDGLFETIGVIDGRARFFRYHMERLAEGCDRLGFPQPDHSVLAREVGRVTKDTHRAVVKIMLTRGEGGRGYRPPSRPDVTRVVMSYDWPPIPDARRNAGAVLTICRTQLSRNNALAGVKHMNRLEQVMARGEWKDDSIDDGVMMDDHGNVIETTRANIFVVRDGTLATPALTHSGVAGVMRRVVIALADKLAIPVRERQLKLEQVLAADEVFLTNVLMEIWPVGGILEHRYPERPVTDRLIAALRHNLEAA